MPIERLSPELDRLVSADQELEELGNGYEVAEGPLWWHEAGHLIFWRSKSLFTISSGLAPRRRGPPFADWY